MKEPLAIDMDRLRAALRRKVPGRQVFSLRELVREIRPEIGALLRSGYYGFREIAGILAENGVEITESSLRIYYYDEENV